MSTTATAAATCLVVLFLLFFRPRDGSSTGLLVVLQKGSQHRIELYALVVNNDTQRRQASSTTIAMETKQNMMASWNDFADNSNLLWIADEHLLSRNTVVPIHDAHSQGWLHRGIWLAVLRHAAADNNNHDIFKANTYQMLLLKRAPTLATCPNSWSLVGEHSDAGETWMQTARRALVEELHINIASDDNHHHQQQRSSFANQTNRNTIFNLVPGHSILVHSHYQDVQRRELQATGLLAIVLDSAHWSKLQPDNEVAKISWLTLNRSWYGLELCNPDITALAHLLGRQLERRGYFTS